MAHIECGTCTDRLLSRLAENEDVLLKFGTLVVEGLHNGRITPACERLLDNFISSKNDSHGQATLAQGLQSRVASPLEDSIGRSSHSQSMAQRDPESPTRHFLTIASTEERRIDILLTLTASQRSHW